MRNFITILLALTTTYQVSAQELEFANDQIIVQFNDDIIFDVESALEQFEFNQKRIDELNLQFNLESVILTGNRHTKHTFLLKFQDQQDISNLIAQYTETGLFRYVEPNYIGHGGGIQQTIPNDTYFSRQYGLLNDGTFSLSPASADADIDMELAWDIEQGDQSIVLGVLDSGLKMDHPEFAGRIWTNGADTPNGSDDDNNGYIDDSAGWDFANNDNDPNDDHGHGTNVGGISAANGNNSIGYAGVDWNCQVMACKILDQNNSGFYSWWADAIYYAVDNGADVLNMSVGGSGFSTTLEDAVNYAYNNGVTIVACMMNEDNNVTYYPAGFQNTIAVGATNPNDERTSPFFWSASSGSCFGSHIDVVAPGNYIYGLSHTSNTNYDSYWGGTSQATPLVAGLSTLLKAQNPGRTPDEIRTIIRNTAEDQVGNSSEDLAGFDNYYGYGRINAHQALLFGTSGLSNISNDELYVRIYPNPGQQFTIISFDQDNNEQKTIELIDESGRILSTTKTSSSQVEVNLSNYSQGVYFVKIIQGEMIILKRISRI